MEEDKYRQAKGDDSVKPVRELGLGSELVVCPDCGYKRGFHNTFEPVKDAFRIIQCCPICGAKFDVGWKVKIG